MHSTTQILLMEFSMTEQMSSEQSRGGVGDLLPLRMKVPMGSLFALVGLIDLWRHGFRNWDWVTPVVFAGLVLLPGYPEPFRRNMRWPIRVLGFFWTVLFVAWSGHILGWIPAACIGVISVLPVPKEKTQLPWWSRIVVDLALAVILLWFARQTGEWVSIPCAGILIYLLSHEQEGRRSLRQNLLRPAFAAWIGITVASIVWSLMRPSFVHFALLAAIVILWFGNLLMHLSSGEPPLALSHPQS
jgi:hypothetical protein